MGAAPPLLETRADTATKAGGDGRALSFCLRETEALSGVMFHLIDHGTVWEPWIDVLVVLAGVGGAAAWNCHRP